VVPETDGVKLMKGFTIQHDGLWSNVKIAIHETMSEQAQLYNTIVSSIYGARRVVLISFISSVIRWVANCKVSQFRASFNIVLPPL
jgi:hypothetical protein